MKARLLCWILGHKYYGPLLTPSNGEYFPFFHYVCERCGLIKASANWKDGVRPA